MSSIPLNLQAVRQRIESATRAAGRPPQSVRLVAVSKTFPPEAVREAAQAGLRDFGENYVQEAIAKRAELADLSDVRWHLIGHLQTNKARVAAGRFALIQSVDSIRLAEALAKIAPAQAALIEVNVAREPQKSGADPKDALDVIQAVASTLDLRGLMAMGPSHGDPTPAFVELRMLREEAEQRLGKSLPILSMGMSGDFEAALAAGSTMLRLGQVLFGPRPARSIVM